MIYNYETLVKGTQVYVELTLTPYTSSSTEGALAAAIEYYAANDNVIGGQSARGHGHVAVEWLTEPPKHKEDYEAYLDQGKEELREGVVSGTLLTDKQVVG